jgi:hypothetical protein
VSSNAQEAQESNGLADDAFFHLARTRWDIRAALYIWKRDLWVAIEFDLFDYYWERGRADYLAACKNPGLN